MTTVERVQSPLKIKLRSQSEWHDNTFIQTKSCVLPRISLQEHLIGVAIGIFSPQVELKTVWKFKVPFHRNQLFTAM